MNKEYSIGRAVVAKENETGNMELEYILTEKELECHGRGYGIKVLKKEENVMEKVKEETGPLSVHKELVLALIERLMECTITPCVLSEVVDEWLETVMG